MESATDNESSARGVGVWRLKQVKIGRLDEHKFCSLGSFRLARVAAGDGRHNQEVIPIICFVEFDRSDAGLKRRKASIRKNNLDGY